MKAGGVVQMKFTTQSWLLSLFYDCPPGLGIHCPTQVCFRWIWILVIARRELR